MHRFVHNFVKENFKENLYTLCEYVYKAFVSSDMSQKALDKLLEELGLELKPEPEAPGRGETRGQTSPQGTEKGPQDPKRSVIQGQGANGQVNVHSDVQQKALLEGFVIPLSALDEFMAKSDRTVKPDDSMGGNRQSRHSASRSADRSGIPGGC